LNLVGKDVPLVKDLHNALNEHMQRVWDDMQPHGVIDLTADVHYWPEQKKFSVGVRAAPQRENTSIEPAHFPYRMAQLQGALMYRDGHAEFKDFKGEHDQVKIAAAGYCDSRPTDAGTRTSTICGPIGFAPTAT